MLGIGPWLLLCGLSAAAEPPTDPEAPPASPDPVAESAGPALPAPTAAPEQKTWVGVLSVLGSRKIPLLGKVEFQTDTFVLARATRRDATHWDVDQATCRVAFPKTMGAQISLDPAAFAKIPHSTLTWEIADDGSWSAGPWASGWSEEDHDRDGEPGITLNVRAPFCGGDLYASSEADQSATGRPDGTHVVAGTIQVHVIQKTLGTKGPCLSLMARDSDEVMDGRFAFLEVPEGTTCDSAQRWPKIEHDSR